MASTKWNEVVHQVNERTYYELDWQWKQEKMQKKNTGMHSWMIKDKWWRMNIKFIAW